MPVKIFQYYCKLADGEIDSEIREGFQSVLELFVQDPNYRIQEIQGPYKFSPSSDEFTSVIYLANVFYEGEPVEPTIRYRRSKKEIEQTMQAWEDSINNVTERVKAIRSAEKII